MGDEDGNQAVINRIVKTAFKPSEGEVLLICVLLCLSIFFFDISTKIGFIISILYLIPAVISIWSPKRRTIFLVATLASILTIVAIPLKPPGDITFAYFNRPVSLIALWLTALLFDSFAAAQTKSRKALKEERDRLSSLIKSINDEVWLADVHGKFTLANPSALREFGLDSGVNGIDVANMASILEVFRPDGSRRPPEEAPQLRALNGEIVRNQEEIVRTPFGDELRYRQVSASPVRDVDGIIVGSVSVVRDITNQKRIEREVEEERARLQAILEYAPVGIAITEWPSGKFLYANDELWRIYHQPATLPTSTEDYVQFRLFHPDGRAFAPNDYPIPRAARGEIVRNEVAALLRGDGTRGYLATNATAIKDANGNIIAVVGMSMDVTEQIESESELRRSNAELQQFAYVASHDLQEPIRMVINYLSLLETRLKDRLDPKTAEYFSYAVEGGARMRQLINDLLEYSRIDKEKVLVPVNMDEVVSETLKLLDMAIVESGVEITVGPLPTIMAGESQMIQVMQNLIDNAIKFRAKEKPTIIISASQGTREWTFSVADNGVGLNMKYADKIFQMFQRLHGMDEYPGTGVGLAVTKKIIERFGGKIWVESEEGKGANFFFTIPIQMG